MSSEPSYQKFIAGLTSFRRDIHQNPEFGFEETRTPRQVAALLKASGVEVTEGVGGTGVVGTSAGMFSLWAACIGRAIADVSCGVSLAAPVRYAASR